MPTSLDGCPHRTEEFFTTIFMTPLLPWIEIESAPLPLCSVIWLHGLGADGHDFASIVPQLDLKGCPPIRFIFPHAPRMPISINGGYMMPAWYDIAQASLVDQQDAPGIQKSEKSIVALIEQEAARGIPYERIVLAGFSQGCAMVLHTGLRFPHRLAGIVALSGYLPLANLFAHERHQANAEVPVFIAHGTQDPIVVLKRGEDTRDALKALAYPVQWHTYLMPHSVHPQEIADIASFLKQVFTAPKTGK
jgi:phospholipase/carboxylesterase